MANIFIGIVIGLAAASVFWIILLRQYADWAAGHYSKGKVWSENNKVNVSNIFFKDVSIKFYKDGRMILRPVKRKLKAKEGV